MRKDKVRATCPRCRHQQVFVRATVNHPLHFILTILTAGLWLVSWIAVCIGRMMRPWRCEHCGWHKPEFTGTAEKLARRAARSRAHPHGTPPLVAAETSRLSP